MAVGTMLKVKSLLGIASAKQHKAAAKYERVADTELVPQQNESVCALLSVKGMTCSACTSAVESALKSVPGVTKAQVALLQESAEVYFNPCHTTADALVSAVDDCGFECKLISQHMPQDEQQEERPQVARLHVSGMTCAACSGAVEKGLLALPGVQHAAVALTQGEAEVTYLPSSITAEALAAAVDDLGFEAKVISHAGLESCTLGVLGMTCSACSSAVERALCAVPGVSSASVSALSGRAQVWYNPTSTGPRAFLDAISAAGFAGSLVTSEDNKDVDHKAELQNWANLLSMSLVFTVPVFFMAMVLPMLPGSEAVLSAPVLWGFRVDEVVKWLLTTPVQFWIGWRFHKGAWKALRRGVANMDVLVALGTDASYFYSLISIVHHRLFQHTAVDYTPTDFFETCAMLITVVILGKYLECAAKGRTSAAIQALLALAPDTATLVQLDEEGRVISEDTIHTSLVHHGDLLKVLPGGRIPADGEMLLGVSYINEAMITGEAQPVLRQAGDALIGGTINTGNALIMKATRVGADTVLAQIVRLVERAQLSKAPIQAYADYVASLFVPVVVGLAVLTWAIWFIAGSVGAFPESWLPLGHSHFLFALLFGIAVLVIACPCALGLATPTAVMVGTGVGAHLGILIKGGDALERGHHVDTVIFDKTGTLTLGKPQVTDAIIFNSDYTMQQVCQLAAAAEAASEHPLARAVLDYAQAVLHNKPAAVATTSKSISTTSPRKSAGKVTSRVTNGFAAVFSIEDDSASSTAHTAFAEAEHAERLRRATLDSKSGPGVGGWSNGKGSQKGSSQPGSQGGGWAGSDVSPASTPNRLRRIISTGLIKVSQVENHPGKGVTAHLPDPSSSKSSSKTGSSSGGKQADPTRLHTVHSSGKLTQQGNADCGLTVALGNRLLMQEQGVLLPAAVEQYMQQREALGQTCVLVSINGKAVAAMAISDPLKPEAAGVVAALQRQGLHCYLLTGDNWRTARAIAQQLSIPSSHVSAEVLPAGKAGVVTQLQGQRRVVAMVGDGINDSPALAAADVGMAIGSGTDIAVEAADYVLMRDDLEQVLVALDLSRKTFRRIQWNFVWAMGYNVVMIPVAAGVLFPSFHVQMPPWVAGGCMVFSSVSVVLSSLLLRRYKPPARVMRGVVVE